jgi:hypothetical protein
VDRDALYHAVPYAAFATWRQGMHNDLREAIFALGTHIRYVAFGDGQQISTMQRPGVAGASEQGSDFYEELLVNPTLLTLTRQRGELDCGGLRHVVVGYGNFHQVVMPYLKGMATCRSVSN